MEVIEDIYRNSIQPSERSMRHDKVYIRTKNKVNQYYQLLSARISENDLLILNKLMLCQDKKTERKNILCFTNGFKKGFAIAIKSMD